jgi:hypothetical protein
MMAEDRAARIVHRLLSPHSSWEQFERMLVSQQRPDWNRVVGLIAGAIREAVLAQMKQGAWVPPVSPYWWRRGRDLNPRSLTAHALSRRARSARLRNLSIPGLLRWRLYHPATRLARMCAVRACRRQSTARF